MPRLREKVALITGAAAGIGEAIARAFVAEGAVAIVTDLRDAPGRAVAESLGPSAEYRHLDVREEQQWSEVFDSVLDRHGRLDVLVNNAGITGFDGDSPRVPGLVLFVFPRILLLLADSGSSAFF